MVQCHALRPFQPVFVKSGLNSLNAATRQVFISYYKISVVLFWMVISFFLILCIFLPSTLLLYKLSTPLCRLNKVLFSIVSLICDQAFIFFSEGKRSAWSQVTVSYFVFRFLLRWAISFSTVCLLLHVLLWFETTQVYHKLTTLQLTRWC